MNQSYNLGRLTKGVMPGTYGNVPVTLLEEFPGQFINAVQFKNKSVRVIGNYNPKQGITKYQVKGFIASHKCSGNVMVETVEPISKELQTELTAIIQKEFKNIPVHFD